MAKKQVVTIGGGTGTFVVLSALRTIADVELTAIVTSADDGGSTGRLRDAYGFLPAGDARQALVALASDTEVMRDLFAYRFSKGDIAGHNLGNLLITALTDLLGSDEKAYEEVSRILRVCGKVIPATNQPATLRASLADGTTLIGEGVISSAPTTARARITHVSLTEKLHIRDSARDAIEHADTIVLGPGRLYSSVIAALLPQGMQEALQASKATMLYVTNLFSSYGETDGYTLRDHVDALAEYAGRRPKHIFVHSGAFSQDVLDWYAREQEFPLVDDLGDDTCIHRASLASVKVVPPIEHDPVRRSLTRHDSDKLKEALAPYL